MIITKRYRSVPVNMEVVENNTYNIISIGIDTTETVTPENVKSIIDKYYLDFKKSLNFYQYCDIEHMFKKRNIILNEFNNGLHLQTLIDTVIIWLSSEYFSKTEKSKLLNYLIDNGLPIERTIRFKSYL